MLKSMSRRESFKESWGERLRYGLFSGFYRLAYPLFCLVYLPHFCARSRQAETPSHMFRQRLGDYRALKKFSEGQGPVLWIHAVSVGEVMAAKAWIQGWREAHSDIRLVVTTVTPTGQKIAQELAGEKIAVCYAPLEYSFSVRKFLDAFQPRMLLLMETELWPNLVIQAGKRGVKIGILNARLSERSARRYQQWKRFLGGVFRRIDFVLAQTEEDRVRFVSLGIPPERTEVAGNMKFDNVALTPPAAGELQAFRSKWGVDEKERIWVAGSTHEGEEEVFLRVFSRLKKKIPALKAIIAPRHIERSAEIYRSLKRFGLSGSLSTDPSAGPFDVLILNELGILKKVYALAELVLVGGSLIPHGGQNPIEPAALARPILAGPHVFNFQQVYNFLKQRRGVILIQNESELEEQALRILLNPEEGRHLGSQAQEVVRSFQGATRHQMQFVWTQFQALSAKKGML